MAAIAVVGMVLVVLGSTLEALALGVHRTATEIGSVFLGQCHSTTSLPAHPLIHLLNHSLLLLIILYF